jgi:hypothetical protein
MEVVELGRFFEFLYIFKQDGRPQHEMTVFDLLWVRRDSTHCINQIKQAQNWDKNSNTHSRFS